MAPPADPLPLARDLIRRASVTPADDGAQDVLAATLAPLGFRIERLRFGAIENLYARRGSGGFHLCFAGHTDVVPPGSAPWSVDPFAGEVRDGFLTGRGACDMKGNIAAFVAAVETHLTAGGAGDHSISLLITGDEEGPAVDGTVKVLDWMADTGEIPHLCVVGEPTSKAVLGDTIKIGRRGSLNAAIRIEGRQGHSAYPQKADNPVHRLVRALAALTAAPLDAGTDWFEPSTLQVTSVDVGNPATNVIPGSASAKLNIRFNDRHTGASLAAWLRATVAQHADRFDCDVSVSGEAFLTRPGELVDRLRAAVARGTGATPTLDTGGGTSDARFIALHCPVAEFGLVGSTMHQADERIPVAELHALSSAYLEVLREFVP